MRLGAQIKAMLIASDTLRRPAPALELAEMAGLAHAPTNRTKLCQRAVQHGLMTVDATIRPMRFQAVDNWRRLAEKEKPIKPAVQIDISRIRNSVFMAL